MQNADLNVNNIIFEYVTEYIILKRKPTSEV